MRRFWQSAALLLIVTSATSAQVFTPGNLVLYRIGDGSAALTNASTGIFLDQFTPVGTFLNSVTIPNNVSATALTGSGNSTSEGALSRSVDGNYLLFAGYNSATGVASIANSAASSVQRGAGRVDAFGNISVSLLGATAFNGITGTAGNPRGATSTNGTDIWVSGTGTAGNGATWYTANGSGTGTQISTTTNNSRVPLVQNGTLYYSTGSGAQGIYSLGAPPTSGSATGTAVITAVAGQGTNPSTFTFSPNGAICYVADGNLGVQKFTFNGSVWSLAYNITTPTTGVTGLVADFSGTNPVLYAVNPGNLFSYTDIGAGAMTSIATAGTNTAFRGIAFAPVPEPTSILAVGVGTLVFGRWVRRRKGQ